MSACPTKTDRTHTNRLTNKTDGIAHLDVYLLRGVHAELSVSKLSKTWTINILVNSKFSNLLIDKGSICINGVSLTIVKAVKNKFTLVIIPHTLKMTNIINLNKNDIVNIEFDIVIKYLSKISNK